MSLIESLFWFLVLGDSSSACCLMIHLAESLNLKDNDEMASYLTELGIAKRRRK